MDFDEYKRRQECAANGCEECKELLRRFDSGGVVPARGYPYQSASDGAYRVRSSQRRAQGIRADEFRDFIAFETAELKNAVIKNNNVRMGKNPSGLLKEKNLMTVIRETTTHYQAFQFTGADSVKELVELGREHNLSVFYREPVEPTITGQGQNLEVVSRGVQEALGFQEDSDYAVTWVAVGGWVFINEGRLSFLTEKQFNDRFETVPETKKK